MPEKPTVLVADGDDARRRSLGLALYEGGYEVINAVNGEEALRFTAGLAPTLVVTQENLQDMGPEELRARLLSTGLDVPPLLVLCTGTPQPSDEFPEGSVYYLDATDIQPARFLHQVRLLLLARDLGGKLSDTVDVLRGDLTKVAVGDLLRVLLRYRLTGHVGLTVGPDAGIWLEDGEVIEAHWATVTGRKAFNRVASLHGGDFVLTVEKPAVERAIGADLSTLVGDAVDERLRLDEAFRGLPSLNARLDLNMDEEFFSVEFTSHEQEVLTHIQEVKTLAGLIDAAPIPDLEVIQVVESLRDRGFLDLSEPEQKIHVVTDSSCDLPPSLVRTGGMTVVPASVLFGNEVYKDGIDLHPDQFYTLLQESDVLPTSSPPGRGEFLEVYRRLVVTGDVVSIHISRQQSQTAEHAQEAAEEGAEELTRLRIEAGLPGAPVIRVVDSWSNSVGLGLLVLFASRMADRGCPVEDIVSRLEDIRERIHLLFVVDTLEFLREGGRIGKARAPLGSLLGVKPVLGMEEGEVVAVDKVRGGRKVPAKLVELFRQRLDEARPVFVALAHAQAPEWGSRLRELLEETFAVVETVESEIGPAVGAHVGPGTVGAVVFQPNADELALLTPDPGEG